MGSPITPFLYFYIRVTSHKRRFVYILEFDIDYLFDDETVAFMMGSSSPEVRKSFLKRMVESIRKLINKASELLQKIADKIRGKKIEDALKDNPTLAKEKVEIKKYDEAVEAGLKAVEQVDRASSIEEVKKIVKKYNAKRNKILTVTATVTIGTLIVGIGARLRNNKRTIRELEDTCLTLSGQIDKIKSDELEKRRELRNELTALSDKHAKETDRLTGSLVDIDVEADFLIQKLKVRQSIGNDLNKDQLQALSALNRIQEYVKRATDTK